MTERSAESAALIVPAGWRDYLRIARLDHSTKHIFIIPGLILALILRGAPEGILALTLLVGFTSAVAIASANYVINEWLDRASDAYHPLKSQRVAVQRVMSPAIVYLEYAVFATLGLALAWQLGTLFFTTSSAFLLSGIIYNVQPIRSKDRTYIDVISESINNPIRLILGWSMIDPYSLPPVSLLLAYWMGGAFLMASKRMSEYRDIVSQQGAVVLHRYRRSFKFYTAENLMVSCLTYAMLAAFFIAVFLVKYRIEYLLVLPFVATLFATYFWLSLRPGSVAQRPERLFRSRRMLAVVSATTIAIIVLSSVDLPFLHELSNPSYVTFDGASLRK